MKIGVPKEIKNNEYRVALTPSSVKTLSDQSHDIYIQSGAGDAIGFTDNDYIKSGATILDSAKDIYETSSFCLLYTSPSPRD